jgi:hypothetical protein
VLTRVKQTRISLRRALERLIFLFSGVVKVAIGERVGHAGPEEQASTISWKLSVLNAAVIRGVHVVQFSYSEGKNKRIRRMQVNFGDTLQG